MALWLMKLGAEVIGYALEPPTSPSHFDLLNLPIKSVIGDIRDLDKLRKVFKSYQPEIVFHMAAQPLVRLSYKQPIETLHTNVIGPANIFEACRSTESVRAIINITSDKCYENKEWVWGYRENDPMGGYDPYSASKGCAELVTSAYRNSFFNLDDYGNKHQVLLSSVRAGNVIGGGDWAKDRIVTDMVEAARQGKTLLFGIRRQPVHGSMYWSRFPVIYCLAKNSWKEKKNLLKPGISGLMMMVSLKLFGSLRKCRRPGTKLIVESNRTKMILMKPGCLNWTVQRPG